IFAIDDMNVLPARGAYALSRLAQHCVGAVHCDQLAALSYRIAHRREVLSSSATNLDDCLTFFQIEITDDSFSSKQKHPSRDVIDRSVQLIILAHRIAMRGTPIDSVASAHNSPTVAK